MINIFPLIFAREREKNKKWFQKLKRKKKNIFFYFSILILNYFVIPNYPYVHIFILLVSLSVFSFDDFINMCIPNRWSFNHQPYGSDKLFSSVVTNEHVDYVYVSHNPLYIHCYSLDFLLLLFCSKNKEKKKKERKKMMKNVKQLNETMSFCLF